MSWPIALIHLASYDAFDFDSIKHSVSYQKKSMAIFYVRARHKATLAMSIEVHQPEIKLNLLAYYVEMRLLHYLVGGIDVLDYFAINI